MHQSESDPLPEEQNDNMSAARRKRLAKIRQEIAAGTYDTPQKLDAAMRQLLQRITDDDAS